ncbi:HAMP domain-containing sensor histidine kinase [Brucella abortus]|nr:HAMP domain-containing sensor histidine kinase [Brucella abortus]
MTFCNRSTLRAFIPRRLLKNWGVRKPANLPAISIPSLEAVEAILGMVLDISRLDTGSLKPETSVFRLDKLLSQIATDFTPLAVKKGLKLRVVPSSIVVKTDRNMLRRLIQNLVSNSIKYSRKGGILLGVRRRGNFVDLQVLDTGIGIAPQKLKLVFREFTRLNEGMREAEGLGLGLSIVDRIARCFRCRCRLPQHPAKVRCFRCAFRFQARRRQPKRLKTVAGLSALPSLTGLASFASTMTSIFYAAWKRC